MPPSALLRSQPVRLLTLLLLVACLGSRSTLAAPIHPVSKHHEKREIEDLEERWRAVQVSGDLTEMDRLMSEDFIGISMTGQANTKTQQLNRFRARRLVVTKMDISDQKIKLVGSVAIVTGLAAVEGTNEGESMQGTYRYTRVYQLLPTGGWKTTNFEVTRVPSGRRP
jgi:ketosteroid isomerase-like protein